jgi:hypothetical protein
MPPIPGAQAALGGLSHRADLWLWSHRKGADRCERRTVLSQRGHDQLERVRDRQRPKRRICCGRWPARLQARGSLVPTEHGGLALGGDAKDVLKGDAAVLIALAPKRRTQTQAPARTGGRRGQSAGRSAVRSAARAAPRSCRRGGPAALCDLSRFYAPRNGRQPARLACPNWASWAGSGLASSRPMATQAALGVKEIDRPRCRVLAPTFFRQIIKQNRAGRVIRVFMPQDHDQRDPQLIDLGSSTASRTPRLRSRPKVTPGSAPAGTCRRPAGSRRRRSSSR